MKDTLWPATIVVGKGKPPKLNSGLVIVAEETFTADPVAVRVAVMVLLVRTVTLPKFKAGTLEVNPPAETPVPARAIRGGRNHAPRSPCPPLLE